MQYSIRLYFLRSAVLEHKTVDCSGARRNFADKASRASVVESAIYQNTGTIL